MAAMIVSYNHRPDAIVTVQPAIGLAALVTGGLILVVASATSARWE